MITASIVIGHYRRQERAPRHRYCRLFMKYQRFTPRRTRGSMALSSGRAGRHNDDLYHRAPQHEQPGCAQAIDNE